MIIDEKRIAEIDAYRNSDGWEIRDNEESSELIRLMYLGIWARDHGIPALRHLDNYMEHGDAASVSLDKLPKDEPCPQ